MSFITGIPSMLIPIPVLLVAGLIFILLTPPRKPTLFSDETTQAEVFTT
jgi:hypothetical protein